MIEPDSWDEPMTLWENLLAWLVVVGLCMVFALFAMWMLSWHDTNEREKIDACFDQANVCQQVDGVWVPVGEEPS